MFFFLISATQVDFLRQAGIAPETKYNCILWLFGGSGHLALQRRKRCVDLHSGYKELVPKPMSLSAAQELQKSLVVNSVLLGKMVLLRVLGALKCKLKLLH